jgi:hypothetical protein
MKANDDRQAEQYGKARVEKFHAEKPVMTGRKGYGRLSLFERRQESEVG